MRQTYRFLIVLTVLFIFMHATNVFAHGWGYKKNERNERPDIGAYEEMIKNHMAVYVDSQTEKEIYLTFDNGYEAGYTEKVLDVLKKTNVPATFFVTGHYVKTAPELVQRIVEEGHIIGNHSNSHPDFTTLTKEEMKRELDSLQEAVAAITPQKETVFLRPPRGTFNERTLQWADELGYVHVFWSLAFKDWETNKQRGWRYAYDEIMQQIHPGAIILLHTVSEDNAEALEKVIVDLKKAGYEFKSLPHLMNKLYIEHGIVL